MVIAIVFLFFFFIILTAMIMEWHNSEIMRLRGLGCICDIAFIGGPSIRADCPVHKGWIEE